MFNSDKNKASGNRHPEKEKQTSNTFNLKPNEAYEPGFGKYTLTESELRAREIKQQDVEKLASKTKQQPGNSVSGTYNGPGVDHYPGRMQSKDEEERKIREENTRKHNNW